MANPTAQSNVAQAGIETLAIDTIRTLAMDAVERAKSGHPGTPMALAPVAYTLWNEVLRYDPEDPNWPGRDRFVLSCGHASMLLYAVLHLAGVKQFAGGKPTGELAVTLDQRGIVEMSCLAGVAAKKQHFLKKLSGRPVWVIDGCPIHCSQGVFEQIGQVADVHIRLHDFGVRKNAPLKSQRDLEQLIDQVLQYAATQAKP